MKRKVAFQDIRETPVAVVEVSRAELGSQDREAELLKELAQLPVFQGFQVVLGVPHDGPLIAEFSAPPQIRMALHNIGWQRLPWREIELPV
jgi:hypothetical protein